MTEIDKLYACLLIGSNGPDERKDLLSKAVQSYSDNKPEHSIYYQVQALFNMLQDRYLCMPETMTMANSKYRTAFAEMKFKDTTTIDDGLVQIALETLKQEKSSSCLINDENRLENSVFSDFLQQISDPVIGFKKIIDICNQFPNEWTILQVLKGPRPQTTYSDFQHIHKRDSDIYLTVLRHARSLEYPEPICLRFSAASQVELFDIFSKIPAECKKYMQVSLKGVLSYDDKYKYWENLKVLDNEIRLAIEKFKEYIFPWIFIFKGKPNGVKKDKDIFREVDKLCDSYNLARKERILLSLACLHVTNLEDIEIQAICEELLINNETAQASALELLKKLRGYPASNTSPIIATDKEITYFPSNYPCILIVDEQLDHFFWEELNVSQEMCRVNSLHCLWKLYTTHKLKIKNGYLCVNITKGGCVLNPDSNLPKTEMRLRSFFEYWKPSWLLKCNDKPTQEELVEFFKRSCYVYAGHGSGLQHISGKQISKLHIEAIVFLFGCDSSRMHSNGLYSDFICPHFFYHAAMCACLVGSILPALDSCMDKVAVELLSRWIAPDSKEFSWQQVDIQLWTKKGIIQKTQTSIREEARIGSLCGALTRIHERGHEKYYYNTAPYVCRGLPVWNCDVQPLPE